MASRIDDIIAQKVAEGPAWDFKSKSYDEIDTDEFLKDVTAFANASGGTIVLGIETDADGRAEKAVGVKVAELDKEIHRFEHLLRDCTDPDVSGSVRISDETSSDGGRFLLVDIEESPTGPHRIKRKGKYKGCVFIREGRRSEEADMADIREMIQGKKRTAALIEDFVSGRANAISRHDLPAGPQAVPQLAIHIVPRRSFGSRRLVDFLLQPENYFRLTPQIGSGFRARPNYLGAISIEHNALRPYNQAFYNGSVEMLRQGFTIRDAQSPIAGALVAEFFFNDLGLVLKTMSDVFDEEAFVVWVNFFQIFQSSIDIPGRSDGLPRPAERFSLPPVTIRTRAADDLTADTIELLDLIWRVWGRDSYNGAQRSA